MLKSYLHFPWPEYILFKHTSNLCITRTKFERKVDFNKNYEKALIGAFTSTLELPTQSHIIPLNIYLVLKLSAVQLWKLNLNAV